MVSVSETIPVAHGQRRNLLRLLGEVVRSRPLPVIVLIVAGLIGNARTGIYVAATGGLTQAILDKSSSDAIAWTAAFVGASAIEALYWPVRGYLLTGILDHAIHRIQGRVLERASSAPLVAFEHGPFFARLQRASDNLGQHVTGIFGAVVDTGQLLVMIGSIMVPLWLIHPLLVPLLIVGCIPGAIVQYRTARGVHEARQPTATRQPSCVSSATGPTLSVAGWRRASAALTTWWPPSA